MIILCYKWSEVSNLSTKKGPCQRFSITNVRTPYTLIESPVSGPDPHSQTPQTSLTRLAPPTIVNNLGSTSRRPKGPGFDLRSVRFDHDIVFELPKVFEVSQSA